MKNKSEQIMKTIKGFKGFNENLQCTPNAKVYQYEIGKEYKEKDAKLCKSGFHFCEYPLDVFGYYPPVSSRFAEVDAADISEDRDSDTKRSCKSIKIGAEISLKSMCEAAVSFIFERVDWGNKKESNTGFQSAATNTGDRSAATNTGDRSAATNTGFQSAATNTGDRSAATNTGDQSAATNTGYQSAATNTGYRSAATNTGDRSAATNTGDRSAATVGGDDSIAVVTGRDSCAKGAFGCWLVLTERDSDYKILRVRAVKVDGKKIKVDTFYKLIDGKVVEKKNV